MLFILDSFVGQPTYVAPCAIAKLLPETPLHLIDYRLVLSLELELDSGSPLGLGRGAHRESYRLRLKTLLLLMHLETNPLISGTHLYYSSYG